MRISRKIGLAFFVSFLLVVILASISVYSIRYVYSSLNQVFTRELPASRTLYEILTSLEDIFSNLNNYLITGNNNISRDITDGIASLKTKIISLDMYLGGEEEKSLYSRLENSAGDINRFIEDIIKRRRDIKGFYDEIVDIRDQYKDIIKNLFLLEEKKAEEETDLLTIQTQHTPASTYLTSIDAEFSRLLTSALYSLNLSMDSSFKPGRPEISRVMEKIREYKNFYIYYMSEESRQYVDKLLRLSQRFDAVVSRIEDSRESIENDLESLGSLEDNLVKITGNLIELKKEEISSRLGVAASLTEDIPAVYNISEIEKDIAGSARFSIKYLLTGNEMYRTLYKKLRDIAERRISEYASHARLRDETRAYNSLIKTKDNMNNGIDRDMGIFEKRRENVNRLRKTYDRINSYIEGLLERNKSYIEGSSDRDAILKSIVPARWLLIKIRANLSRAMEMAIAYIYYGQDSDYKDIYSDIYFELKDWAARYRKVANDTGNTGESETIEKGIDEFNSLLINLWDIQDEIIKTTGWELVVLKKELQGSMSYIIDRELKGIEEARRLIKRKVMGINLLIAIIIILIAAIALAVIYYTRNFITQPMRKLYEGASVIGKGDLGHRLDIKTGDEIEELANGFNKMAGELKELYTGLENKVKERTRQLAEANEALALKNKELDDFTYIVSHDLKEPLRGVKAFTKLLTEEYSDRLDEEAKGYLRTISESSSRMTRLIEDLLNLSRIGRIKNIESGVDINKVLDDVKKNLQYSLEEKQARLNIQKGMPRLKCDRIRIGEVFSNLISNAIKYSREGVPPVIDVGFSDKADYYEFYVRDNGIGIDKKYHDKVFLIFQRLHPKGGYEGTGAGLTIVKKIIENHGGNVWLESEPDKGSTFYFTLPKGA